MLWVVGGLLILVGIAMCFFGYRLFRIWLAAAGLVRGRSLGRVCRRNLSARRCVAGTVGDSSRAAVRFRRVLCVPAGCYPHRRGAGRGAGGACYVHLRPHRHSGAAHRRGYRRGAGQHLPQAIYHRGAARSTARTSWALARKRSLPCRPLRWTSSSPPRRAYRGISSSLCWRSRWPAQSCSSKRTRGGS